MEIKKLKLQITNIWHPIEELPELGHPIILLRQMTSGIENEQDKNFYKSIVKPKTTYNNEQLSYDTISGYFIYHKKYKYVFIQDPLLYEDCSFVKNKLWNTWNKLKKQSNDQFTKEKTKWAYLKDLILLTYEN